MHTPRKNHHIPLLKDYLSEGGEWDRGKSRVEGDEVMLMVGWWEEMHKRWVGVVLKPHLSMFLFDTIGHVCTNTCMWCFFGLNRALLCFTCEVI